MRLNGEKEKEKGGGGWRACQAVLRGNVLFPGRRKNNENHLLVLFDIVGKPLPPPPPPSHHAQWFKLPEFGQEVVWE